jgi:exosortase E/protease (VPEID-CTERM system)
MLKSHNEELRFSGLLFSAHLVCVVAVVLCNMAALHGAGEFASRPAHFALSAAVVAAITLLALACVPMQAWIGIARSMTSLCIAALLAGVAAGSLRHPLQLLWNSSSFSPGGALQTATFCCVRLLLHPLLPDLTAEPTTFILGTPRFLVFIAPECSGMEGLGLVLVFTGMWLWYFRKESRFPQALLLIPCALISVWLLNILRIAAIILIGSAGAADVAMVGFHSQAGWIAFTAVAVMFSMATRRIRWVRRDSLQLDKLADVRTGSFEADESPATAAFLAPLLALLAASFVSRAASGTFEWLYPLRFIAGTIAIWFFRREYARLDWRCGWMAPVIGAGVFLLFIARSLGSHNSSASSFVSAPASASPAMRLFWIAVHIAATTTTVPIAEELAFRGYLARRVINRDFEAVPYSRLTWLSIGVSSVGFGLMQGSHWMAGIVAGAVYAWLLKQRGRIGDAIMAHATTNLLLAAWVILRGDWSLW